MIGCAGSHDGRGVIPVGNLDERMIGIAPQQMTQDAPFDPSQDGRQKAQDKILNERGNSRQIGRGGAQRWWYTDRHTAS